MDAETEFKVKLALKMIDHNLERVQTNMKWLLSLLYFEPGSREAGEAEGKVMGHAGFDSWDRPESVLAVCTTTEGDRKMGGDDQH